MLRARIDSKQLNAILDNAVSYSYGFLEGTDIAQIDFNRRLGEFTEEALGKYIDSQARMNPEALHHVYEWDCIGNENDRLFIITSRASKRVISFNGKFIKSKSISENSSEPFANKAEVMENAISVTIEPKNSSVLVFEDDGDTVFTVNSIYIDNPGGDEVAGSFGRVVEDFFENYFTNSLLTPFMQTLSKPNEYASGFPSGTRVGKAAGIKSGIAYMNSAGMNIA